MHHRFVSSSVTYVAGAHTFKAGGQWGFGELRSGQSDHQRRSQPTLSKRCPGLGAVVYNTPTFSDNRLNADLGFYVQDAWHVTDRLTLSPGLRFEYLNATIGGSVRPGGPLCAGPGFPRHIQPAQLVRSGAEIRRGLRPDRRRKNRAERHRQQIQQEFPGGPGGSVQSAVPAELTPATGATVITSRARPPARAWRCRPTATTSPRTTRSGRATTELFGAAPNRHFDPDSKRPYDIEYTLGVEREVARRPVGWRHVDSEGLVQPPADDQPGDRRLRLYLVSSAQSAAERRDPHHLQPQPGQAGTGRSTRHHGRWFESAASTSTAST